MQMLLFLTVIQTLGTIVIAETSTYAPVNRGAARQMFGSGNLRQLSSETTVNPSKVANDVKKAHGHDAAKKLPGHHETHPESPAGHGYTFKLRTHGGHSQVPDDFHPRFPEPEPDYDEPIDGPSFRNGFYGQARPAEQDRSAFDRSRGRIYGSFDAGEFPDRSRVHHGLGKGHGINPFGDADQTRFEPDQKNLMHELDEETDLKPTHICDIITCDENQLICPTSCACIDFNLQCDGYMDCETGDDEIDCEEILDARRNNGSCEGEKKILCPKSGLCISEQWLCDGDDDCGDYTDESHCGNRINCTKDQFECKNGLCLPQLWRCDGENDCMDFSDEEDCYIERKCQADEYKCPTGFCIPRIFVCDGDEDCDNGADELDCHEGPEVFCDSNHFECTTPRCIRKEFRCDGNDDCGDASDEEGCSDFCNSNEFKCANGTCISRDLTCNGQFDCRLGEDEIGCRTPVRRICSETHNFTCLPGECVPKSWVCDGAPDCSNGADEDGCPVTCDATQYLCKAPSNASQTPEQHHQLFQHVHAFCISRKHLCDGRADCPLKEDELNCSKSRKCTSSDHCTQQCIVTASGETACACNPGFVLGPDNVTCNDFDECAIWRDPVCSQKCTNTRGSFVCSCITGYVLRPDLRTCKALGGNPSLLFANRVDIRKVSLEPAINSKYTPIIKGRHNAVALDYHYDKDLIYWSDVSLDVIRSVHMNGSSPEDVIRWGLESPGGLAVDWIHNLLFWTDGRTRRVEVFTLDTKIRHVLISSDLDKPRAIVVHPHYGYVFWTDWGQTPKIERADMDGSARVALFTDDITWPNGLAIDYPTDRIFWTEAKLRVILSARLDGTDKKKVLSKGLHHPFAITVFEDMIYWTDWHFKSISAANKETGHGFKTIRSGLHFPMDLHSFHKQRQPNYPNHCGDNNGKCSHMCLPNSAGYTCVCPVNLKLKRDGKNCIVDIFLILARKHDLRLIPIDKTTRVFDTVIPVDHVHSAVAVDWDSETDMVYWADVELNAISRAHLNGSEQSVVVSHNLETPAGLALDWITKKLYWTDAGTNRIECSNLDGSMRSLLIYEGLDKPRDIVVDPTVGYFYWSDWGEKPRIERAAMDGSERKVLVEQNLAWPNGLAIDFDTRRLYWADGGRKSIEYIDLEGKIKPVKVLSKLPHPFGLVIHQSKVYWTDWDTRSIHRADKETGSGAMVVRSNFNGLMDVRMYHTNRSIVANPCKKDNGMCSHLCLLTPWSVNHEKFTCACPTGLILEPNSNWGSQNSNNKQCRAIPNEFIIIARRVDIRVLSFDTKYRVDVALPIRFLKNVTGVDVNRRTGQIFWTDPGKDVISRATFDGKHIENIISTGIDTVDSLVVDSISRKLYWTDAGLNSIEVSELDGTNRKLLIWTGLDKPRAIALHYGRGLMFWSDWGVNARIERANMDGSERTTVVAEDLIWPNGLSIDLEDDKIYWNDAKRKVIEMSNLDGTNRRVVVKNVQYPYGLAVVGSFLYWSDWITKCIHRVDKSTGDNPKKIVEKLEGIMDIRAVSGAHDLASFTDVCRENNGGCSHLCLRTPRGFSCLCPTGILLGADKKTCKSTPDNFLLLTGANSLARISLDTPEMRDVILPVTDIYHCNSIDFHWQKGLIVYVATDYQRDDVTFRCIKTLNIHNVSDVKTIVSGESDSYSQVAVDWLAGNIYWSDEKKTVIEVARMDGSSRKILIKDPDIASSWNIAVFPRLGYLFWTQRGVKVNIHRALLDGTNRKVIISSDLSYPSGLSIDYKTKKLYWADLMNNKIEISDLNGRYRVQLLPLAEAPLGLTQFRDHIYWMGHLPHVPRLRRADKTTGSNRVSIRTSLLDITKIKVISAELQSGWTPCVEDNGGCSHLCLFTRKNYSCACPDIADTSCSTLAKRAVPLRKPGTENDPDYDLDDDDVKVPEIITKIPHNDDKFKNRPNDHNTTMITTIVISAVITLIIIIVIVYLMVCQRKPKQEEYAYPGRRNVMTFSNPNYNASSGTDITPSSNGQSEKKFIWKRLKYDSSQERVYEDNGQTSSPEIVSLIPPSATPSSSRAPSVTPKESSPSLIHVTHLNG